VIEGVEVAREAFTLPENERADGEGAVYETGGEETGRGAVVDAERADEEHLPAEHGGDAGEAGGDPAPGGEEQPHAGEGAGDRGDGGEPGRIPRSPRVVHPSPTYHAPISASPMITGAARRIASPTRTTIAAAYSSHPRTGSATDASSAGCGPLRT
jgi:hypothetical protein